MPGGGILFTAFEPSGDALAARLIEALRQDGYDGPIHALGGPKMEAAGARLVEHTTGHAAMLLGAASQAYDHHRRLRRLRRWLHDHPLDAHVPTDSPAANFSICALVRRTRPQAKIVHLVAPQLWAWGRWRVRKLRRLTDRLLCLLPFEVEWFESRGVPATFVGHPLFERLEPSPRSAELPDHAGARLAVLPGSRSAEIKANWPTMRAVVERLRREVPDLHAAVAASDDERAALVTSLGGGELPGDTSMLVGDAGAVLDWAGSAMIVSGTASLEAATRNVPMAVLYNASRWQWELLGKRLVAARTFALPNIITESLGEDRCVPEFVPHFGSVEPVAEATRAVLTDDAARAAQRAAFARIAATFAAARFRDAATRTLRETAGV